MYSILINIKEDTFLEKKKKEDPHVTHFPTAKDTKAPEAA